MEKKSMHNGKMVLCREMEEILDKGKMSAGDLENLHKLTDTYKNILKIEMLEDEEGGYSEDGRMYGSMRETRGHYSRDGGRGGYNMAGGDWEARGSYGGNSYDDGGSSYARRGTHYVRGHYSRDGGYSRGDGKDRMMHELGEMMEGADHEQRRILERAMQEIRKA